VFDQANTGTPLPNVPVSRVYLTINGFPDVREIPRLYVGLAARGKSTVLFAISQANDLEVVANVPAKALEAAIPPRVTRTTASVMNLINLLETIG